MKKLSSFFLALFLLFSFSFLQLQADHPYYPDQQLPPTYYPEFCHFLTSVSAMADSLVIEDESVWTIFPPSKNVLQWLVSDPVIITLNNDWYNPHNFKYKIINKLTKQSVYANLYLGPKLHNPKTLFINQIDRQKLKVQLSNGSTWKVHPKEAKKLSQWEVNDVIIIGKLEEQATSFFDNLFYGNFPFMDQLLINTTISQHIIVQNLN